MKNSPQKLQMQSQQDISSDDLDLFVSALQENTPPQKQSLSPEERTALRLHILTANDHIDPTFAAQLKKDILAANANTPASEHRFRRTFFRWRNILIPLAPLSVTAAVIVLVIQFNHDEEQQISVNDATQQTQTVQPLFGTPIRSEQGNTSSTTETDLARYDIDYAEFQQKLNERASTSIIDVSKTEIIPTDDSENQKQYYTDLRSTAQTLLDTDKEIATLLGDGGMDVTKINTHIETFEYTITTWPTDQDPLNSTAYGNAVEDIVEYNTEWNALMKEVTEKLLQDYQDQHPEWRPIEPLNP